MDSTSRRFLRVTTWLCMLLPLLLLLFSTTASARWKPRPNLTFDYLLGTTPRKPPANAKVVFLDGFDTSKATVARYHREGVRVVCYINVGAWENWRSDKNKFPKRVLGNDYDGWAGERWLDIRKLSVLKPIMRARLNMCKSKGFDGVDPDNVNSYQNHTGFKIRRKHQLNYLRWLISEAHRRNLAIGLKNAPGLVEVLVKRADFMVTESCFEQGWCSKTLPFIKRRKAVFAVEYEEEGMTTGKFCNKAKRRKISGLLKRYDLKRWRRTCN